MTTSVSFDDDALDLADEIEDIEEAEEEAPAVRPFSLSGMQSGDEYSNEYEDDVDGIVDPLAGLRSGDDAGFGFTPPPASPAADPEPLDLDEGYATYSDAEDGADEGPEQDDLLASADRLAADNQPVEARLGGNRRRGLLGGEGDEGGPATGGSTLFERMANLSRSTARDEDDDDGGDDGPALSIPRFLGRQNNQ
jgi:cell division protein FtsZ